ncbi:hypothetical protein with SCP/PR1 domain-containing protein [Pseudomonas knackmussii B13]|uniref:SCP domain-containing protein n=1 Tax=Pseudomonas knackmussii (strain DSM 6978 / CCUG 54928 / LMG 23759 / B13) TaxID=1301098 RepID=A0A024HF75_PSEKB|nr:CAP domain-containing protein [Pseudomonas knackmussii]CDF83093.1 hypothetical protein with SCP/PR1 domain-containing protein [Pseudomonas knackmussii B13]
MRVLPFVLRCLLLPLGLSAAAAHAANQQALLDAINDFRSQPQSCGGQASAPLPPLTEDPRLVQTPTAGDWQVLLKQSGYPMSSARMLGLTGPKDEQAAMTALRESFCQVILDPQFVDIGVNRNGNDWRILLARPLLKGKLGDWQAEGQQLLQLVNKARSQARQCGGQPYAAAPPLSWNAVLGSTAEAHSRDMANNNYFDHKDRAGQTPGDRAELAGYSAQQIGENIAAGQGTPQRVLDGWLASAGHCANLMNPQFREMGAAYAVDPKSDAGIYWTGMFGAQ